MNLRPPKIFAIYSAIEERQKLNDERRYERIELIYELADTETKRWLNALVTEICDKSLEELLRES